MMHSSACPAKGLRLLSIQQSERSSETDKNRQELEYKIAMPVQRVAELTLLFWMYDESIGLLPIDDGEPCPIFSLLWVLLSSTDTMFKC